MSDCLFCKFVAREIVPDVVAESEHAKASAEELADLVLLARAAARQDGLVDGYRLVFNTGAQAGQTVFHAHLHVLGGRTMEWPPG